MSNRILSKLMVTGNDMHSIVYEKEHPFLSPTVRFKLPDGVEAVGRFLFSVAESYGDDYTAFGVDAIGDEAVVFFHRDKLLSVDDRNSRRHHRYTKVMQKVDSDGSVKVFIDDLVIAELSKDGVVFHTETIYTIAVCTTSN